MTTKMKLMALGLSMALFTGCGAVDDLVDKYAGDDEEEFDGTFEGTSAADAKVYMLGEWSTGCKNDYGNNNERSSYIREIVLHENGQVETSKKGYEGLNCRPTNEISSNTEDATYTVGDEMIAQDGGGANTLDLVFEDGEFYTMVRKTVIDGRQGLWIAFEAEGDIHNGETAETRVDYFAHSVSESFVRPSSLPVPPTPAAAAAEDIIGGWNTGCVYDSIDDTSYTEDLSFGSDGIVYRSEEVYEGAGCVQFITSEYESFTYTLGDETLAEDGTGAVELNLIIDGIEYYTMVRVDAVSLISAHQGEFDTNDGLTTEARVNNFTDSDSLYRLY